MAKETISRHDKGSEVASLSKTRSKIVLLLGFLVNLEYNAWFAVIDPTNNNKNDPVSLYDHLV